MNEINVGLDFGDKPIVVGKLATRNHVIYFEYDDEFIQGGLEISPFRLSLRKGVVELPRRPFEGLAGVFSDSLPDGWGRLLFDRIVRSQGFFPATISPLNRLAHVGLHGMGALIYEPDHSPDEYHGLINLDQLASQAEEVLVGAAQDVIKELLDLNGSSGGARPKALIGVHADKKNITYGVKALELGFEPWLVKFPSTYDGDDAGVIEYVYALMAKDAGICMSDVHLFSSDRSPGFFAVKRFDRVGSKRLHMHTASGLLHSDFRAPSLDYDDLLNLTRALTKDAQEVEKMFRLAVFNVFSHNKDDHGKNFSYLMNRSGQWNFAPAYDLTFSSGPNGEQSTMVKGEGRSPKVQHLIKLGIDHGFTLKFVKEIIDQTRNSLDNWGNLAKEFDVSKENIKLIGQLISQNKFTA